VELGNRSLAACSVTTHIHCRTDAAAGNKIGRVDGRSQDGSLTGEETKDSLADQGHLGSLVGILDGSGRAIE
jgi:hypothetical protein